MEEDNNIKNISAADIERYHKGLMSPKEMHVLEKAAMDDPFLADALEGYSVTGVNATDDLIDLRSRLGERTGESKLIAMPKRSGRYWLKVAAMIVVVAGAGILAYTLLNKSRQESNLVHVPQTQNNSGTLKSADSNNALKDFLQTDTLQNSLAAQKSALSPDTEKTQALNRLPYTTNANAAEYKRDSIGVSVANTTRDLAAARAGVLSEIKNSDTALVIIDQKKDVAKEESLRIVPQSRKTDDKDIEGNITLRENAAKSVTKPDAAFSKNRDADKYAERRNAQGAINNYRQQGDSTNYGRLNVFRGRVTDASNNGIPFANVTINDVNVGTYADAKGNFSLVAPDSVLSVSLRAVGFNNSQVQLRNILPSNQVVLQEDRTIDAIVMSNKKPNVKRSRSAEMELTEPEPDDGWEKYDSYLANNLKVPEAKDDLERKAGGVVELAFDINSDGEPVNIKVTKSLCKECDEEAIRLIKDGPKWKKKKKLGKGKVTVAF